MFRLLLRFVLSKNLKAPESVENIPALYNSIFVDPYVQKCIGKKNEFF